jgi:hypothetical protein
MTMMALIYENESYSTRTNPADTLSGWRLRKGGTLISTVVAGTAALGC